MQRKFSNLEQDPVAAAHARGDSSDPSEQSETLSQTELHKMQRELSHRYLVENKKKFIKIVKLGYCHVDKFGTKLTYRARACRN